MFTDEATQRVIHADLDRTVIHGTLCICHLVPAFLEVIKETPEYEQILMSNNQYIKKIFDPTTEDTDECWESDDMVYFLNEELQDILDSYAPDGYYFGAHIGDGSDFGYWMTEEYYKFCEACNEVGIKDNGSRWCYKDLQYRDIEALIRENGLDYDFFDVDIPEFCKWKYIG